MNKYKHIKFLSVIISIVFLGVGLTSCDKEKDNISTKEGIAKSTLTFTEVSGETVEAHGDHFHGLDAGVEGESITVEFDEHGHAKTNGHLHLHAEAAYKIVLRAWDFEGKEVQDEFIASKSVADSYKAFLVGGDFILNAATNMETGAIFQPREKMYADGTAVNGKYEVTGILSYFTAGHDNAGATKAVTFILRKLEDVSIKGKIERVDWNRSDYQTTFPGENVLALQFEIHVEGHHEH